MSARPLSEAVQNLSLNNTGSTKPRNSPSACDSALGQSTSTVSSNASQDGNNSNQPHHPVEEEQQQPKPKIVYKRRQRRKSAGNAQSFENEHGGSPQDENAEITRFKEEVTVNAGELDPIELTAPSTDPLAELFSGLDAATDSTSLFAAASAQFNSSFRGRKMSGGGEDMWMGEGQVIGGRAQFKKQRSTGERKPRNCISLSISKNGGGGKFTWGRPGDEWKAPCPSGEHDQCDPNYDEFEEDENTFFEQTIRTYTDGDICEALNGTFQDFLTNGDERELIDVIGVMQSNQPSGLKGKLLSRILFHVLLWGLESKKTQRGHVWSLYVQILGLGSMKNGDAEVSLTKALEDFFDARKEIILDCPDYDEYVQKLIACFLYKFGSGSSFFDEFIQRQIILRHSTFKKVMNVAYSIANRIKSEQQIMQSIWTVDDYLTTEQLSLAMAKIVDDWAQDGFSYISLAEDLRDGFKAPHFYHELVYLILLKAIAVGGRESMSHVVETLMYLVQNKALVTQNQVQMGFKRVYKEMDDLAVDVPAVSTL